MREKLYRGIRVDNGEWMYGFYVKYGFTGKEKHYIVPSYASALYAIEVIPETVGEFTGLTNKNGTKIFEGDIIQEEEMVSVCRFLCCVGSYAFVPVEMYKDDEEELYLTSNFRKLHELYEDSGTDLFFENDTPWKYVCVIGNIHDNPELLEGEDAE
ncbi:YopX family protein [Anaerotignum sp. MB30-C6]|uniref:YopX family protein n=1 Tax=Anaerotignum sp. MB30-C6 TaxID=3070814 RepID=UPI0027DCD0AE|nr:YopX family protein [Anaerotignum sp. MB30-C6]WMI81821.1 YopX family protein [Anaerotignum sp. MB30-C6]